VCYVVFTCLWSLIWVQGARNYQFSSIFLAGKNIFILTYWPMGLYSNIKPIFDVKPMGFYAREYGTTFCDHTNSEGILMMLDFKQPFDTLEQNYMYSVLKHFFCIKKVEKCCQI